MTTEHPPRTGLRTLPADLGPSTSGHHTHTPFIFITATNHRPVISGLFFQPCIHESLNRFCWRASQTADKWPDPVSRGWQSGPLPNKADSGQHAFTVP